jgi:hypothetical protein
MAKNILDDLLCDDLDYISNAEMVMDCATNYYLKS